MDNSETAVTIDLRHLGRGLDIPLRQIQATVELLDEGNTVPFITRYRKDQTGGLDEEQIREIQSRLRAMRLLADRKQTILRSIDSQGKLTEELQKRILAAATPKRLEDLYLPFKPKKTSLATLARSRGLDVLADEIFSAAPSCADLDARSAEYVSVDRQVATAADALLGAGHILAERISEMAELRQKLREIIQRSGAIVCSRIHAEPKPAPEEAKKPVAEEIKEKEEDKKEEPEIKAEEKEPASTAQPQAEAENEPAPVTEETPSVEPVAEQPEEPATEATDETAQQPAENGSTTATPTDTAAPTDEEAAEPAAPTETETTDAPAEPTPPAEQKPNAAEQKKLARQKAKEAAKLKREQFKKKREEKQIKAFSDYFDYRESLRRIPPHRTLAINRGERAKILRVRIESDLQTMVNIVDETVVPSAHPHADYLRGCARDALSRLILPSLEREVRREATERAETHAVNVFAKNLRNLLLQPPIHDQRILAVDPGFRSGCKLAALDQFGNLLDHGVIHLVGKPDRREEAKKMVLDLIEKHQLTVIVIGNGTACRQTEDFVAQLIENELKDKGVAYVIVNEAGASVYSTSRTGREEFPECDAVLRGAISIGRRLQDPLSELVKIDPANIGVGLYQHDVKAKHLRTTLDEVVESCVNYVGVDANTASPALLRYVSGLNQLTARRLCEYRREHGPFKTREQLREVPGLGEATFVQAAGFLKIPRGENLLDATWIHPESYETANGVVGRLLGPEADLSNKETVAALADPIAKVELAAMAGELEVGELTLKDILTQLVRPGRDPREDLPAPVFKRGVLNLEDLEANMELTGTVLNVVDFGCFVDIGMHHSGLVHVSRLADKYIRDPHDVVAVGDIVKVWVLGIDKERQRVSLTMVQPGTEKPKQSSPHHKPAGGGRDQKEKTEGGRPPRRRQDGDRPRGKRPEGRREQRGRGHGRQDQRQTSYRPRPRPKPLTPITDEMKTGKTPMRTFGDLLQFYQQKPGDEPDQPKPAEEETPKPEAVDAVPAPPVEQPAPPADQPAPPPAEPEAPVEEKPEPPATEPAPEKPEVVAEEKPEPPAVEPASETPEVAAEESPEQPPQ